MRTNIRRVSVPVDSRIIAVSDIHAHLTLFKALLEKIAYTPDDALFVVGDLVVKGTENLATLRYLMKLDESPQVHVLMGNAEYYQLQMLDDDTSAGHARFVKSMLWQRDTFGSGLYSEMLEELGFPLDENTDGSAAQARIRTAFAPEIAFMRGLPTIIETEHIIFVHGGIPSENLAAFEGTEAYQYLKNDDFISQGLSFSKYIVTGHWPVNNYQDKMCHMPFFSPAQRILGIDGGCGVVQSGQLNGVIITDAARMAYEVDYTDAHPVCIAQDTQKECAESVHIHFTNRHVRILQRQDEKTQIEHLATGRRLWVPNERIWTEDGTPVEEGKTACCTYTDYRLPVTPGERLGVYHQEPDGYRVKKNGVCGLYSGRLLSMNA